MRLVQRIAVLALTAPCAFSQIVVRTDLQVNDVYYSKSTGLLYVTTASTSPDAPNSLLALNPATGQDVWHIAAGGTDPGEIAGSDDGNFAYVYLESAALIQRFDLQGRQADLQFPATMTGAASPITVSSMKVIQGDPHTVAISFANPNVDPSHLGIALFHDGVQLPNTVPGSTSCLTMAYGATPATMWCHDSENTAFTLYQLSVDSNGIQTVGPGLPGLAYGFAQTPQFYNGRLFFNSLGLIVDPVRRIQVALLPEVGTPTGDFTVDPDAGLVYFSRSAGYDRAFWVLDANRFTPVAFADTTHAPNNQWIQRSLTRCGAGGLAGINEAGELAIVPLSVMATLPILTPGTPTSDQNGVLRLAMPNQSLAYSPVPDKLYASVPDAIPGLGNSIVPLDPNSLAPSNPLWIGSRPSVMAVTQDGQHLYQALAGSSVLRRINLSPFAPDLDTPLYAAAGAPIGALSLAPLPASPDSIAVARGSAGDPSQLEAIAVYDHGAVRPQIVTGTWTTVLALDDTGTILYGLNGATTNAGLNSYAITPQGVSLLPNSLLVSPFDQLNSDLKCAAGTCLTSYGIVLDAVNNRILGHCPLSSPGSPLLDLTDRRGYFLIAEASDIEITSCNLDTFLPAEQFILPAQPQFSGNLVLSRPDQFAFNTGNEIVTAPKSALAAVPATPPPQPSTLNGQVQLPLTVDIGVYDPVRDRLYVALTYSNAGTLGNSIGVVRPDTGALESTIPIGGEPSVLALSTDSSRLFVALHWAQAVVQLNLAARTIEQQIPLGSEVSAMCAVPGQASSVVVADQTAIHAFDGGVQRPQVVQGGKYLPPTAIAFGPTADAFYSLASGGWVGAWQLTSSGIAQTASLYLNISGNTLTRIGSRLFTNGGSVLSIPSLAWIDQIPSVDSVIADPVTQQLYSAWSDNVSVYSAASLAVIARFAATGAQHRPLVPCGAQRVASLAGGIVFYPLSMGALPHLPASLSPDNDGIARLNVPVSSIAWDARSSRLLAAALPASGPDGNSLFSFEPASGTVRIATAIGNQPGEISLAPDAHVAYVATLGAGTVERVNLDSSAIEQSWTISVQDPNAGSLVPYQIVALAASGDSLIVNAMNRYVTDSPLFLMVLDNGIPRPDMIGRFPNAFYGSIIASDNSGQHVYLGANSWLAVDTSGVTQVQGSAIAGLRGFSQAAACGGLLYLNSGQVVDPASSRIVADYGSATQPNAGASDRIACEGANDRVILLTSTAEDYTLRAFQISTGAAQGQLLFGNVSGGVMDLILAGPAFAALRTDQSLLVLPLSRLTASQPTPAIGAVANAASYAQGGFAPGSIVTIFGSGLASWTAQAMSFPFSTLLADATVFVGGQVAYALYVSPTQINLVLPSRVPSGQADLELQVAALSVKTTIPIVSTAPGLFTLDGSHAAVQNQDYSTNSASNPAVAGSVIMAYFTGQGQTVVPAFDGQPAPVSPTANATVATTTATVGGQPATVLYSGLTPGLAGLAQANIRLPNLSPGDYQLVLTVGGSDSNAALISVK